MKIVVADKKTLFNNLNAGDLFKIYGEKYCIVIEEIYTEEDEPFNAVCLETGTPIFIPYVKEVTPIIGTLTVEA